jgi:hypothetical protein
MLLWPALRHEWLLQGKHAHLGQAQCLETMFADSGCVSG